MAAIAKRCSGRSAAIVERSARRVDGVGITDNSRKIEAPAPVRREASGEREKQTKRSNRSAPEATQRLKSNR
jgi:hypothetical protein